MASDDNETKAPSQPAQRAQRDPTASPALPDKVERALTEARDAARRRGAEKGTKSARWLALIPVTATVLMGLLMMPRAAVPEEIPLPAIDGRALGATMSEDDALAAKSRTERLSGDLLRIGTAVRAFNRASLPGSTPELVTSARTELDDSVRDYAGRDPKGVYDGLRTLRAAQLDGFLTEVTRWESTGEISKELEDLGGGFVERMNDAGWVRNGKILLDDTQRRVAYKLVWTASVGAEQSPALKLTLDEQRALYTLYLSRPHAPEGLRTAFDARRKTATTDADCTKANDIERLALEAWRMDKIKRFGELDPTYPTAYALGVANYRAGRYEPAAEAFRAWIEKHPEGRLSLRAQNYLKAALTANGPT